MRALRRLLLPFALIYGVIIYLRNFLYDTGKIKSNVFSIPIIGIGNLSSGGTGKTPHVEYIIRLFRKEFRLATLSRGYGRKSSGYILAKTPEDTHHIGDEP